MLTKTPAAELNTTTRPVHGTPEWNAIYDAGRKAAGYPSRDELAAFEKRWPIIGKPTAEEIAEYRAAQADRVQA